RGAMAPSGLVWRVCFHCHTSVVTMLKCEQRSTSPSGPRLNEDSVLTTACVTVISAIWIYYYKPAGSSIILNSRVAHTKSQAQFSTAWISMDGSAEFPWELRRRA